MKARNCPIRMIRQIVLLAQLFRFLLVRSYRELNRWLRHSVPYTISATIIEFCGCCECLLRRAASQHDGAMLNVRLGPFVPKEKGRSSKMLLSGERQLRALFSGFLRRNEWPFLVTFTNFNLLYMLLRSPLSVIQNICIE